MGPYGEAKRLVLHRQAYRQSSLGHVVWRLRQAEPVGYDELARRGNSRGTARANGVCDDQARRAPAWHRPRVWQGLPDDRALRDYLIDGRVHAECRGCLRLTTCEIGSTVITRTRVSERR